MVMGRERHIDYFQMQIGGLRAVSNFGNWLGSDGRRRTKEEAALL